MAHRSSYTHRMIRQAVSEHCVPRRSSPTPADLASDVYRQTWTRGLETVVIEVLALNPAQASAFGRSALRAKDLDPGLFTLSDQCAIQSPKTWLQLLDSEPPNQRRSREDAYALAPNAVVHR